MSNEILDLCRDIKRTVDRQPTRSDMEMIASNAVSSAIKEHEHNCPVASAFPDIKEQLGKLQASNPQTTPNDRNRALLAIGTIIGVGVPIGIGVWKAFF